MVTKSSISSVATHVSWFSGLTAPFTIRRRFNSNWSEGCEWLCVMRGQVEVLCFASGADNSRRVSFRNQFVPGCS